MIFPQDFESKIGFDTIRNLLESYCSSELGREEVRNMHFSSTHSDITHKLQCVDEMMQIKSQALPMPAIGPLDILPALLSIKSQHSYMTEQNLLKLGHMLQNFSEIQNFFASERNLDTNIPNYPNLDSIISNLLTFPSIVKIINDAVNKFGEVKDTASPALYDIRQDIKKAQGSMHRAMRRVLDNAVAKGLVDKDTSPSIRDGRLVIPVNAADKRQISGIVQDESASGKTVFIEPSEVVEAANHLRELQIEERREIVAVLIGIADIIRPSIEDMVSSCNIIGMLDFIVAKSLLAIDLNAHLPHINEKPELEWYHAEHPSLILSLRSSNRKVVPLNITLSSKNRILIISGPNAGGKSVCLKTVAAVQYMMQCGLMPTIADNSHMGIFKNIFIDIGDEQSFENDLSTYSSHLKNMRFFLKNSNKNSLLLADEMGSGTEPLIGGAIAQAILNQLGHTCCYGIVTTHYQNLKTFADNTPGFINGAMLYDRARLEPTFQLSIGNAGSSFAIDIANKMGLPKEVIEDAKKIVGEDYINLDKYLSEIARDRKYWANKRQNIKEKENKLDSILSDYEDLAGNLTAQRKLIISEARKEAQEILKSANAKIERTILEIRKVQAEKEKTKLLRKELNEFVKDNSRVEENSIVPKQIRNLKHKSRKNKELEKIPVAPTIADRPFEVGDYVLLDSNTQPGKILSIDGKKAEVAFGALRSFVDISRIKLTKKPKTAPLLTDFGLSSTTYDDSRERQLKFKNEIDVRGMRADEAIQAVTYFIDDAIQFNASKVRILHGTGHGILKTLIRQQLKANPNIRYFGDEDIRLGGAGITVVEIE